MLTLHIVSAQSFNVNTVFPASISACSEAKLDVTITNTLADDVDSVTIDLDFTNGASLLYDAIMMQSCGGALVETGADPELKLNGLAGATPWINEIHYRNAGLDVNEFVEIAGPAGLDLTQVEVYLYNGSNGQFYSFRNDLVGTIPNESCGFGSVAVTFPIQNPNIGSIQNGFPAATGDGVALVYQGQVVQFISYSSNAANASTATFTATNGPANGMTSGAIGVVEPDGASTTSSVVFNNGAWTYDATATQTPGVLNPNQEVNNVKSFTLTLKSLCKYLSNNPASFNFTVNYYINGVVTAVEETINFVIEEPDVVISSSTPNNINTAIGDHFEISNTLTNNGLVIADSVYVCVLNNNNATLDSITVNGVRISAEVSSPAGMQCFNLGNIASMGMLTVVEHWTTETCEMPEVIKRFSSYGCEGNFNCQEEQEPFTETVYTFTPPSNPLLITTMNSPDLSVCGASEVLCINVQNTDPNFSLFNVKVSVFEEIGKNFDFSQYLKKSGPEGALNMTQDTVIIPELAPNETFSFSIELNVSCLYEAFSLDYRVDGMWNELCETVNNIDSVRSSSMSIKFAELSILPGIMGNLRPNKNIYDAVLNVVDTLKVPMINGGAGSVDSFIYYVVTPPTLDHVGLSFGPRALTQIGVSVDTVFYKVTADDILFAHQNGYGNFQNAVDGNLDENEGLVFCEIWNGKECKFDQLKEIERRVRYGCEGVEVCNESSRSLTGISYGFAIPDLEYSIYNPLVLRPACYADEEYQNGIKIKNTGLSDASNITLNLVQASYFPSSIVGGSIEYSFDENGPYTTAGESNIVLAAGVPGSSGQCITGNNYYRSVTADLGAFKLPAGDSIYVRYKLAQGCDCRPCDVAYMGRSYINKMTWEDNCLARTFNNNDLLEFRYLNAFFDGYFDGNSNAGGDGSSGCIKYNIVSSSSSWHNSNYPNAYFDFEFQVESGVDVTSVMLYNADGSINNSMSNYLYSDNQSTGNDTGSFRINNNLADDGKYVEFCYDVDCAEKPAGGCNLEAKISIDNFLVTDPSCPSGCRPNLNCEDEFSLIFSCTCLPCDGMSTTDLSIRRTNYGLLDSNNDDIPDNGNQKADETNANSTVFVQGDSLRLSTKGVVSGSGTYDFAYLDFNVGANQFEI